VVQSRGQVCPPFNQTGVEKNMNPHFRHQCQLHKDSDYCDIDENLTLLLDDLRDLAKHPHYYTSAYIYSIVENLYEIQVILNKKFPLELNEDGDEE
jgi:hypothetical protein